MRVRGECATGIGEGLLLYVHAVDWNGVKEQTSEKMKRRCDQGIKRVSIGCYIFFG
jgi:hypothetical protein